MRRGPVLTLDPYGRCLQARTGWPKRAGLGGLARADWPGQVVPTLADVNPRLRRLVIPGALVLLIAIVLVSAALRG